MDKSDSQHYFDIFSYNVFNYMCAHDLTYREIEKRTGVSQSAIARAVLDKKPISLTNLLRLARGFGLSMDWLMGLINEETLGISEHDKKIIDAYQIATPEDKKIIDAVLDKYVKEDQ